jgi:AraC-like DNA-binding protein
MTRPSSSRAVGAAGVPDKLIRSASLAGYVELMLELGHDPQALLRDVGLSARWLDDPETPISVHAVRELLEVSARTTGAQDFGLRLAERRSFSNLGPISLVLKEEPTPRQALHTLCRYLKLLSPALVIRIEDAGANAIIRQDLLPIAGLSARQSIELSVGVVFRLLRELIGPGWQARQVSFMHRAPADTATHRAFFGRAPLFNQAFNGLVCALADLHLQRSPDNPGAARFARDHFEAALRRRGDGMRASCKALILALLSGGRCTAEQVALHLGIDRRTLHRHLSAEGQSFLTLLDEIRMELVLRHLRESDLPLGEVASLLGLSGPSSFSHWFRAKFGTSVSGWRRQHIAPTGPFMQSRPPTLG